jgi:hypothetical protein
VVGAQSSFAGLEDLRPGGVAVRAARTNRQPLCTPDASYTVFGT